MSSRLPFLSGFLVCMALIAIALYLQQVEGLEPCPLCILQRIAFIAMGICFFVAFVHNPSHRGRRVYGALVTLFGLFGIAIAGRHVWLQNIPAAQVPECGPGLEYLWETIPLTQFLQTVFQGSGECAEIAWQFLWLTMPEWSLVWLAALTVFSMRIMLHRPR